MGFIQAAFLCCGVYILCNAFPALAQVPPSSSDGSAMETWKLVAIVVPCVVGGLTLITCFVCCCCCRNGRCVCCDDMSVEKGGGRMNDGFMTSNSYTNPTARPLPAITSGPTYSQGQYVSSLDVNGASKYAGFSRQGKSCNSGACQRGRGGCQQQGGPIYGRQAGGCGCGR